MAVLGVLIRIDPADRESTLDRLERLDGATLVPVEEAGRVGLVIEADSPDRAREILQRQVDVTRGVLGTWPVYSHLEPEPQCDRPVRTRKTIS